MKGHIRYNRPRSASIGNCILSVESIHHSTAMELFKEHILLFDTDQQLQITMIQVFRTRKFRSRARRTLVVNSQNRFWGCQSSKKHLTHQ